MVRAHQLNINTMRFPAQLPEKPSYQRWTRLQPMLEAPAQSWYDRALGPADFDAENKEKSSAHMGGPSSTLETMHVLTF